MQGRLAKSHQQQQRQKQCLDECVLPIKEVRFRNVQIDFVKSSSFVFLFPATPVLCCNSSWPKISFVVLIKVHHKQQDKVRILSKHNTRIMLQEFLATRAPGRW